MTAHIENGVLVVVPETMAEEIDLAWWFKTNRPTGVMIVTLVTDMEAF